MAVSAMLAIGVLPDTKRKSSGEYPRPASKAFAKMGHSATPKGRSSVGAPYSSQSGCPMVARGCIVLQCEVQESREKWVGFEAVACNFTAVEALRPGC